MNASQIKLIAITTMVIDHVGFFFFPDLLILRIIGRLSYPLFAWLIANGAHYTKNINKYFARLLIFAFISQPIYVLVFRTVIPGFSELNVLFTLAAGLLMIIALKKMQNMLIKTLSVVALSALGYYMGSDYGVIGILMVLAFYLGYRNINKTAFLIVPLIALPYVFYALLYLFAGETLITTNLYQLYAIFALIIITFYNQKEGIKLKALFYLFYPLHLLLIYLIKISLY